MLLFRWANVIHPIPLQKKNSCLPHAYPWKMLPGSFGFLLRPSSYSALASTYFFSWRHPIAKNHFFSYASTIFHSNGACKHPISHAKTFVLFFGVKVCRQFRNTISWSFGLCKAPMNHLGPSLESQQLPCAGNTCHLSHTHTKATPSTNLALVASRQLK